MITHVLLDTLELFVSNVIYTIFEDLDSMHKVTSFLAANVCHSSKM